MGWWRVAPGKWLLFYAPGGPFPKRPGARWLPDDDPTIGWKKPKPIYLSYTDNMHQLAIDIVATRGAIQGFEYMIASTDRSPIDKMKVRRNSHVRRILRLNALVSDDDTSHLAELVRRYNLGTSRFGPSQQPRFFCCAYELHNRVEQNEGRDVYSLQALAVYEQYLLDKYKYADMQYEFHPGAGTVLVLFRPSTGQYCVYLGLEIAR